MTATWDEFKTRFGWMSEGRQPEEFTSSCEELAEL